MISIAIALAACALVGCVLITGDSKDYSTPVMPALACQSAKDCVDAGGGVCCAIPAPSSPLGIATQCQTACIAQQPQVCSSNDECGGAACLKQSCAAFPISFSACGVVTCPRLCDGGLCPADASVNDAAPETSVDAASDAIADAADAG